MADSGITRRALAQALKQLMREQPFEKVSVGEICEACDMNRKSFYYHFRDKYELVEWIFENEFVSTLKEEEKKDRWLFLGRICHYFYREREFYVNILRVRGQNAFTQCLWNFLYEASENYYRAVTGAQEEALGEDAAFFYAFVIDALVLSIYRWLMEGARIPPEKFLQRLQNISRYAAKFVGESSGGTPTEEEQAEGTRGNTHE